MNGRTELNAMKWKTITQQNKLPPNIKQSERQNGYGTVNNKLPPYISEQLEKFLQYVCTYTTHLHHLAIAHTKQQ